MPDDNALPYDTSYVSSHTPAGEGWVAFRIFDDSTWWYFFSTGTFSLDVNTSQGNLSENTVAVRLGPRTHVQVRDSGGFWEGDSGTVDLYNDNYTDNFFEDGRFVDQSIVADGVR